MHAQYSEDLKNGWPFPWKKISEITVTVINVKKYT